MRSRSSRPRAPTLIAVSACLCLVAPLPGCRCGRGAAVHLAPPDAAPKDSQVGCTSTVAGRPAPEVAVTADVLAQVPSPPDATTAGEVPTSTEVGNAIADAEIPHCVAN